MSDYEYRRSLEAQRPPEEPLLRAIALGDGKQVEEILNSQHSLNLKNTRYMIKACELGYTDIAKILLFHGANSNKSYPTEYSGLFIACQDGNEELLRVLLSNDKTDMLPRFVCGTTPLGTLLVKFAGSAASHSKNASELEVMCRLYLEALERASITPPLTLLAESIASLLQANVVTIPALIIKLFPKVVSTFQGKYGHSIAEYAKRVHVSPQKLPFLGAGNVFMALRNREHGLYSSEELVTDSSLHNNKEEGPVVLAASSSSPGAHHGRG